MTEESNITIGETIALKNQLSLQIAHLLLAFTRKTGLEVSWVELETVRSYVASPDMISDYLVKVEAKL